MSSLVSLALAAEARGRALTLLADARRQNDQVRLELEQLARELVDDGYRRSAIAAAAGAQLRLPTFEAAYGLRSAELDRIRRARRLHTIAGEAA